VKNCPYPIFPTSYQLRDERNSRGFCVGVADHATEAKGWCHDMLEAEHSLGAGHPAGKQLWQIIKRPGDEVAVAVVVWAASALHLKERDLWIGWDPMRRASRLNLIVGNSRLLILEATREPNLASQVLSAALRVLPEQWEAAHGYKPLLAEAFTDVETHHGTTYKVTNWTALGLTKGFARQRADFYVANERPKKLWVKELYPEARTILCKPTLPPELQVAQIAPAFCRSQLSIGQARSLREVLRQIPDPRRSSHTYKLSGMLTAVAMGILAGEVSFNGVMRFIRRLTQDMRRTLGFPKKKEANFYRVPSYNALADTLRKLDLEQVSHLFAQWEQAHQGQLPRSLAFDGKDLGKGLGHLISLVISTGEEAGTPMAQRTVDPGHEQAAALSILTDPAVQIEGHILTADALHCQHKQLQAIGARGGEFVISLKDNQKTALEYAKSQLETSTPLLPPSRKRSAGA
jgi:hypothetical protein